MRNTGRAVDSSYRSWKASLLRDRIDDTGHPSRVGVYCSEDDENRKNPSANSTVNAQSVRENRGEWSDTTSSFVGLSSNSRKGDREIQSADHDDTKDNASVEVSLWVLELLRHVGHVLITKVGPEDESGCRAYRDSSVGEEWREILESNEWSRRDHRSEQ